LTAPPLRNRNEAGAKVEGNQGFEVEEAAWLSHNEGKARQSDQNRRK